MSGGRGARGSVEGRERAGWVGDGGTVFAAAAGDVEREEVAVGEVAFRVKAGGEGEVNLDALTGFGDAVAAVLGV